MSGREDEKDEENERGREDRRVREMGKREEGEGKREDRIRMERGQGMMRMWKGKGERKGK